MGGKSYTWIFDCMGVKVSAIEVIIIIINNIILITITMKKIILAALSLPKSSSSPQPNWKKIPQTDEAIYSICIRNSLY